MKAQANIDAVLELAPPSTPAAMEWRRKLHSIGNAASALIASTQSPEARQLAWIAVEWASATKFAPLPETNLAEIFRFCRRLMVTAVQAEAINDDLEAANA